MLYIYTENIIVIIKIKKFWKAMFRFVEGSGGSIYTSSISNIGSDLWLWTIEGLRKSSLIKCQITKKPKLGVLY